VIAGEAGGVGVQREVAVARVAEERVAREVAVDARLISNPLGPVTTFVVEDVTTFKGRSRVRWKRQKDRTSR